MKLPPEATPAGTRAATEAARAMRHASPRQKDLNPALPGLSYRSRWGLLSQPCRR